MASKALPVLLQTAWEPPSKATPQDGAEKTSQAKGKDLSLAGVNGILQKAEGRDKLARVFQYGSRAVIGYVELSGAQAGSELLELKDRATDLMDVLSGARRTMRWGKEIPVIQAVPKSLELMRTNFVDGFLELVNKINLIGYLVFDHLVFVKKLKLLTGGKSAKDTGILSMTCYTIYNMAATIIQFRKWRKEEDHEKRATARTQCFKSFLLVWQGLHSSELYKTHNLPIGLFGVVTSLIDVRTQWPSKK